MDTWNNARAFMPRRVKLYGVPLRGALLLLGFAGVTWFSVSLPQFWSAVVAKQAAARIIAGERFKTSTLNEVQASIRVVGRALLIPRNDMVRAEALIHLQIVEDEIRKWGGGDLDLETGVGDENLKSALCLNPADSLLWLLLYSKQLALQGHNAKTIYALDQSYAVSPLEEGVALRRNKLGLAAFPGLSEATQAMVVAEFRAIVESGFVGEAAVNLEGIGWMQRDRLLASLADSDLIAREALAKRLWRDGVPLEVPGVAIHERTRR